MEIRGPDSDAFGLSLGWRRFCVVNGPAAFWLLFSLPQVCGRENGIAAMVTFEGGSMRETKRCARSKTASGIRKRNDFFLCPPPSPHTTSPPPRLEGPGLMFARSISEETGENSAYKRRRYWGRPFFVAHEKRLAHNNESPQRHHRALCAGPFGLWYWCSLFLPKSVLLSLLAFGSPAANARGDIPATIKGQKAKGLLGPLLEYMCCLNQHAARHEMPPPAQQEQG